MTLSLRRTFNRYGAIAALAPKFFLAYTGWVWMDLFTQALGMTIFVYFWRGIYAQQDTIGGLQMDQTLNYILMAQVVGGAVGSSMIYRMGSLLREGLIGIELLRPVDFQAANYVQNLANMVIALIVGLPLVILAIVAFGMHLPTDPLVWLCFFIALLLGHAAMFLFNYILGTLTFYTTEVWGLGVLMFSVERFFSGWLIPLGMLPGWLQAVSAALPFAQAVYVPVSILSGVTPLADVPRLWVIQLLWIAGLLVISRVSFAFAVRKVTVQGG